MIIKIYENIFLYTYFLILFTSFPTEDVPFKGSNGSNPFILNKNWCKKRKKLKIWKIRY